MYKTVKYLYSYLLIVRSLFCIYFKPQTFIAAERNSLKSCARISYMYFNNYVIY